MQSQPSRVLVLLADGRLSAAQAERLLFPSSGDDCAYVDAGRVFWSVLAFAVIVLSMSLLPGLRCSGYLQPGLHSCISWMNGPTVARHIHAIFNQLLGGFL